jgi:hypothetical protein
VTSNDTREQIVGWLDFLLHVSTMVLFCRWMWRMHCNARVRAGGYFRFGPHAWIWFFAPIFNLFRPYQVILELWRKSAQTASRPWFFPLWWTLWLFTGCVALIGSWASLVNAPLMALDALLALALVRALYRAQQPLV